MTGALPSLSLKIKIGLEVRTVPASHRFINRRAGAKQPFQWNGKGVAKRSEPHTNRHKSVG